MKLCLLSEKCGAGLGVWLLGDLLRNWKLDWFRAARAPRLVPSSHWARSGHVRQFNQPRLSPISMRGWCRGTSLTRRQLIPARPPCIPSEAEQEAAKSRSFQSACAFSGGGVRIHPENSCMSGRHGVQNVAQCVACETLALVAGQ